MTPRERAAIESLLSACQRGQKAFPNLMRSEARAMLAMSDAQTELEAMLESEVAK